VKTIGLVGGSSWVSSADYYKLLNEGINKRLGGLEFARCIMYSFNFADIKKINESQEWPTMLRLATDVCRNLTTSGAECVVLCSNTMHVIADELAKNIDIPVIHIAKATAKAIEQKKLKKIGLLGTKFTMEMDYFKRNLLDRGMEATIPSEADQAFVHASIFDELGKGMFLPGTNRRYLEIIDSLASNGAEGIVLGCTEIPLLIKQTDCSIPLFDTLAIHVDAAVQYALR
jgi:aspartate racemase